MIETRKNIKVFLGSPGDLGDERKVAKAVVDELNSLLAPQFGYQFELIGWEDTVTVYGRPQATINRELERCQLFVGMMWRHWGTPPDTTGRYTSGFEEEFRESVARHLREGTPEISMFFKAIDSDLTRDPGPALGKVLAFRKELIDGKAILFEEFADAADFERKLRRCLSAYLFRLKNEEDASQGQEQAAEPPTKAEDVATPVHGPLTAEGASFLRGLVTEHEQDGSPAVMAADVARLRLLADMVRTAQNDTDPLGVHDLNLLFFEKDRFDYSSREIHQLISGGLEHYLSENTPMWGWSVRGQRNIQKSLLFFSFVGRTQRRIGALRAMTVIGLTDLAMEAVEREAIVGSWLDTEAPSNLRREALRYLDQWGTDADIPLIKQEIDRRDSQTTNAAFEAIVSIRLRDGRESALVALNELQPSSVSERLIRAVFDNHHALSRDALVVGMTHACADVRRACGVALLERGEYPLALASGFSSDPDPGVRLVALQALEANDHHFTMDQVKSILSPPTKPTNNLFSGHNKATEIWEEYRLERLRRMTVKALEDETKFQTLYDRDAYFALAEKAFGKMGDALKVSIANGFKAEFEQEYDKIAALPGPPEDLLKKTRSLETFVRLAMTRRGLDIVVRRLNAKDIGLVRRTLTEGGVKWNALDMAYFAKFGEWSDTAMVMAGCEDWDSPGNSLLSLTIAPSQKYAPTAAALSTIGKGRLYELLCLKGSARVRANLAEMASDTAFRALSDAQIETLLEDESDIVRKAVILKFARAVSRKRISEFLERYVGGAGQRYYNVIHWADMAATLPKEQLTPAVDRVFKEIL